MNYKNSNQKKTFFSSSPNLPRLVSLICSSMGVGGGVGGGGGGGGGGEKKRKKGRVMTALNAKLELCNLSQIFATRSGGMIPNGK